MASEVRLKDLPDAATSPAMDDYIVIDGDGPLSWVEHT